MSDGGYEQKATPAKSGGKKKGAGPPKPKQLETRIMDYKIEGGLTRVIMPVGEEHGVELDAHAKMVQDGDFAGDPDLTISGLTGNRCSATTKHTVGDIKRSDGTNRAVIIDL